MTRSCRTALIMLSLLLITLLSAQTKTNPSPKDVVGKINDKVYTYGEYNSILNNYYDYWQQRDGKKLTPERKAELNNQCWNELIGRYIYDNEIKTRKVTVTDQEAYNAAVKTPPQQVKQIEALKTNGKFDPAKFKMALDKDATFKKNVLDLMKEGMVYDKLLTTIKSKAVVKPDSVKQAWDKDHNLATGKVIVFDYTKVPTIAVADSEAQRYYKEHYETYKREPARIFKYVTLVNNISAADSAVAKAKADSLYDALSKGADFAELAKKYSADPGSGKNGGELGWFERNRMVKPFADAAFALNKGEISHPVLSQFGWHIIQTTDKRTSESGAEEVNARHILIKPEPSPATLQRNQELQDKLITLMKDKGIDYAAAFLQLPLSETPEIYEKTRAIPTLGPQPDLIKNAFAKGAGFIPEPIHGRNGEIYVVQVTDSLGTHYSPFESEKKGIVTTLEKEKKVAENYRIAKDFYTRHLGSDMLTVAAKDSLKIVDFTDLKQGGSITGINNSTALVDNILAVQDSGYVAPLVVDSNTCIAHVAKRVHPSAKQWEKEKNSVMAKARTSEQDKYLNTWYYARRNSLKIEDNRKDYYKLPAPMQPQFKLQ